MGHTRTEFFHRTRSVPLAFVAGMIFVSGGCSPESGTGLGGATAAAEHENTENPRDPAGEDMQMGTTDTDKAYVLNHQIEMIDGDLQSLEQYKGNVVLMVNVASQCGYTKQYTELEAIYRAYKDRGFVVIGFPANDFGAQEPGSNEEIAQFCSSKFDVTFPMAAKIHVKGESVAPLYKQLADQAPPIGGEPGWNFTKFLVGKDGRVVNRFDTKISPDDPTVIGAIEQQLDSD